MKIDIFSLILKRPEKVSFANLMKGFEKQTTTQNGYAQKIRTKAFEIAEGEDEKGKIWNENNVGGFFLNFQFNFN